MMEKESANRKRKNNPDKREEAIKEYQKFVKNKI